MFAAYLLLCSTLAVAAQPDAQQAAHDAKVVEALLRLKGVDVNASPQLKSAVLRHLETHRGTEKYVDLVRRIKVRGVEDELMRLAVRDSAATMGVQAATLLLEWDETERFSRLFSGDDPTVGTKAVEVLGFVGNRQALDLLQPLVTSEVKRSVRVAAAIALGRNRNGQQFLLELVEQGSLPPDLKFTVANALYGSQDPRIRAEVAKYLQLPIAANSKPLPPIAELVKLTGNSFNGAKLFQTTATCAKCHKVNGQGKEVGSDLSEIGSKLSREAFFVSILDPSAGISHNYETYMLILDSGNIVSGLMVNRTDTSITIRTAEAIDKKIATEKIDELVKSTVSLMPADIQKMLNVQDLVDVVEYLTTLKKRGGETSDF